MPNRPPTCPCGMGVLLAAGKVARYLFDRQDAKLVFFGRFVSVLRTYAAFLAGTTEMRWRRFLVANAAAGILRAAICTSVGYLAGHRLERGRRSWPATLRRRFRRSPVRARDLMPVPAAGADSRRGCRWGRPSSVRPTSRPRRTSRRSRDGHIRSVFASPQTIILMTGPSCIKPNPAGSGALLQRAGAAQRAGPGIRTRRTGCRTSTRLGCGRSPTASPARAAADRSSRRR